MQSIIKNGLIPQINSNSALCGETFPRAYVCSVQDIKYWAHLLDAEVLLELTPRMPLKMELYSYGRYDELLLYETNLFRVTEIVRPNDVRALFELQQDIAQYITSIKQPKVDRYLGNTDTRTFDTVTVEITLVSSNKQERNSKLRENVGKLTTIVLDWVATSKRYTKYGIPVCYLKPAQFTITSDERLVMLFTLKDGLESIPDVV